MVITIVHISNINIVNIIFSHDSSVVGFQGKDTAIHQKYQTTIRYMTTMSMW